MKQSQINKLRRTKRGHARAPWHRGVAVESRKLVEHNSTTHAVATGFGYISSEISDCNETVETHLIPRESLTDKQNLRNNVRPLAGVVVKGCIVRVKDGKRINTEDIPNPGKDVRITLMSDRSLLNRGNPFKDSTPQQLRRKPSRSAKMEYPDKIGDFDLLNNRKQAREICLDLEEDLKNTSHYKK